MKSIAYLAVAAALSSIPALARSADALSPQQRACADRAEAVSEALLHTAGPVVATCVGIVARVSTQGTGSTDAVSEPRAVLSTQNSGA